MTLFLFILGLVLLVGGAEILVKGAARIAAAAGITPLVVGLTVVAFGTSAPELAVTLAATARGEPDLALGNVVGSNIMNVLLILGLSAAVAPLSVRRRVVRLEAPLLIAVSVLVLVMALDGVIGRIEGMALLAGGVTYTALLVHHSRRPRPLEGERRPRGPGLPDRTPDTRHARSARRVGMDMARIIAGLVLLVLGSHWIVEGARAMAAAMGVSELAIGLTVVAIGTSLPELATSVVATIRGERDIAVGNIVGSNLFNLLVVLGAGATLSGDGVAAAASAVAFDLPVMIAVAVACMPVFFTGRVISRPEGILFLTYFVAYTAYVLLAATGHGALHLLRDALLFFALPLTVLTLGLTAIREMRR